MRPMSEPRREPVLPWSEAGAAAIVLTLLVSGCGPTDKEIGTAGIIAAPFAFMAAALGCWAMLLLWRWQLGPRTPNWRAFKLGLAGFMLLAVLASRFGPIDPELVGLAVLLCSLATFAFALISARFALRGRLVLELVPVIVTAVVLVPCAIAWLGESEIAEFGAGAAAFVIVGHIYVTPFVGAGLIVEALVRRARATQ